MKVLVTGSSGFIGKELVNELRKRRVEVVEFSKSRGGNILDKEALNNACKNCDAVIHLAALIGEFKPLEELREVNVQGTQNVLEASVRQKVKKFIHASTTGVYGDFKGQASEEFPLTPTTNYEKSKAEAEGIVQSFQELISIVIARIALVFGPSEYCKEITQMIKKGLPMIGSGNNKWQIVYYKDLVDALIFLLNNPEAENETYNIAEAPKQAKTLNEVIELFKKETGIKRRTMHAPVWLGKIMLDIKGIIDKVQGRKTYVSSKYVERLLKNRDYSIEKIRKLGWQPKYSTEEAIKETVRELSVK